MLLIWSPLDLNEPSHGRRNDHIALVLLRNIGYIWHRKTRRSQVDLRVRRKFLRPRMDVWCSNPPDWPVDCRSLRPFFYPQSPGHFA